MIRYLILAESLWSAEQVTGVVTMSPKVGIEPDGFPLATERVLNGVV